MYLLQLKRVNGGRQKNKINVKKQKQTILKNYMILSDPKWKCGIQHEALICRQTTTELFILTFKKLDLDLLSWVSVIRMKV